MVGRVTGRGTESNTGRRREERASAFIADVFSRLSLLPPIFLSGRDASADFSFVRLSRVLFAMLVRIERDKVLNAVIAMVSVDVVNVPAVRNGAVIGFPLCAMKELVPTMTAGTVIPVQLLVVANTVEGFVLALRLAGRRPSSLGGAGSA